ncbi:hypothetical protein HanRHA438_Chr13g0610551 [Helianthus annuus]|nr:hypothetical protein HanRHA438_Chr13g0610551 [Helianthus annuus]
MPAPLSLSLSLSLFGDSRSGSRVFLHHVSTTPIPHGNHTVLSKSNSSLGFELHGVRVEDDASCCFNWWWLATIEMVVVCGLWW